MQVQDRGSNVISLARADSLMVGDHANSRENARRQFALFGNGLLADLFPGIERYTLEIMTHASVTIQITRQSKPAMPSWMGEVAAIGHVLIHTGALKTIQEQVRFARARFGQYDLIDLVVVLIGYILSGETDLARVLRTARSVG